MHANMRCNQCAHKECGVRMYLTERKEQSAREKRRRRRRKRSRRQRRHRKPRRQRRPPRWRRSSGTKAWNSPFPEPFLSFSRQRRWNWSLYTFIAPAWSPPAAEWYPVQRSSYGLRATGSEFCKSRADEVNYSRGGWIWLFFLILIKLNNWDKNNLGVA